MSRITVAAVQVAGYEPETVAGGIAAALDLLGGLDSFIQCGDRVLLKPNLLEGVPVECAVTTHPEVLRAVIRQVKALGAVPVVGDSPGVSGTVKAAEKCGIAAVCREEGVQLIPFEATAEYPFPAGLTIRKFQLTAALRQVDKVITLAKLKTHTFMGMTGATKILFGCVVGMQKAQFHLRTQHRREFAGMLVDLANLIRPALSIVDGVIGMEGNGPRNGKPVAGGIVLAGANCFAVDVVMAKIMGFDPASLPVTALALERGLTPDLAGIECIGDGREIRHSFQAPRSMMSLTDRLPRWAAELGRSQLTARPEIADTCIGCGRCAAHCPPGAMTVAGGKVHIDDDTCIRCYCCQELCPQDAVNLRESRLLRLARRLFF